MFEIIYDYFVSTIQLAFVIGLIALFVHYVNRKQSYWYDRNVPFIKPIFLLGTDLEFGLDDWPSIVQRRVRRYGRFFGGYQMMKPVLTVMDPELIKQIFIKDFHCFINRSQLRTYHELLNQNLLFSEDKKWKRMRSITSPSFSTGKLSSMTKTMNDCIDRLLNAFERIVEKNDGELETKKIIAGFTMDVIASAGFSTQIDANLGEDDQFFRSALGLFRGPNLRVMAAFTLPRFLLNLLNIRYAFSAESFEYFCNLTTEIIRQRKTMKQKPMDLLQLMLEAEADEKTVENLTDFEKLEATDLEDKETSEQNDGEQMKINKKKLTQSEIIANAIFFLIAGFETTASTISHSLFLLAWNPDVQQRVYEELCENLNDLDINSKEYYDKVMLDLPYFQAVIKETLRVYPPVTLLTRMVTTDEYVLNNVPLTRGTLIHVPAHAIHHCEDYYPDPERFNPERFMPENKDQLVPYTYMPFGLGPRNCIGMRFAYQEIRLALSRIIMEYRFETIDGVTPKTLTFGKRSPLIISSPFKLRIIKR